MTRADKNCITLILALTITFIAYAEVKLPAIVSSHMVLQRNTTVNLWGWADAKEQITINASWLAKPLKIQASGDGKWEVEVKTTNSKEPQTIQIQSKESDILLEDILFGEVWLCSGQSNMQQSFKGYQGEPTIYDPITIAKVNNPNLRLFTVTRAATIGNPPLEDLSAYTAWQSARLDNIMDFSAVAYHFGQQLQEVLDVPVGLIHSSWGGSPVQTWMSKEAYQPYIDIDNYRTDLPSKYVHHSPTALFNAMIYPIIKYAIKGAIWYQGESNKEQPNMYKKLFPAMVKDWRSRWEQGDFPFYYVQIAPFLYGGNEHFHFPDNTAFIREAQEECLELIPNSGMAITMDIGEELTIHPSNKQDVGNRLLYHALNQTYGFKTIAYEGPVYDSLELQDKGIILKFKNVERGVYAHDELLGFEIAGKDKVFYPAKATIINKKRDVFVSSEQVPNPVAVRYAWSNWIKGTLYNTDFLPASSFRTDDWEQATRSE